MKQEFFFLSEEWLWIWLRLGPKQDGLDWAITPFGDRDSRVFILHIDAIEWGGILFITVKKGKLRKFKNSIH
jgi:hypothetical protein